MHSTPKPAGGFSAGTRLRGIRGAAKARGLWLLENLILAAMGMVVVWMFALLVDGWGANCYQAGTLSQEEWFDFRATVDRWFPAGLWIGAAAGIVLPALWIRWRE